MQDAQLETRGPNGRQRRGGDEVIIGKGTRELTETAGVDIDGGDCTGGQ